MIIDPLSPADDSSFAALDEHVEAGTEIIRGTLFELIERQALLSPDTVCLVFADQRWTYLQLLHRVTNLAASLVKAGIRPGRVIAVAVPRSDDLVVAALAAIAVGAAYLPLDLDLPAGRISHMLQDAQPDCILVSPRTTWLPQTQVPILSTTCDPGQESFRYSAFDSGEAAYVMYTSGSTGRPKGVVVSHLSIVNHLAWMQREYQLGAADRVLHKTPVGFDVSVWEIFWPLLVGATLVVAEPQAHRDPQELARLINAEKITTVHFVPSMLDVFLEYVEQENLRLPAVLRVFCSGEVLSADLVRRFATCCDAALHNLYGPTEAAIDVTFQRCDALAGRQQVPIGQPVANTGIHILDEHLREVPPRAKGELYIAGIQLARGYLNDPKLTAERFIACPFGPPGELMYRTGDLASRNEYGEIEYAGRTDDQVKIAGVRIELAEIEAVLLEHPAVSRCAVITTSTEDGEARVEAFVTLSPSTDPGLRRLVARQANPQGPKTIDLAPGLPVCVLNETEARFMYREIFEEMVYGPEVAQLPEGAHVFDIGANIGLFSLFIALANPASRIHAFEPIPAVFDVLQQNIELYGMDIRARRYGLADAAAESTEFTFYPHVSLISGRHAHRESDAAAVLAYAKSDHTLTAGDDDALADLLDSRLISESVHAPLTTISQAIDAAGITELALLKIDVERSEWEVLAGIEQRHWPIIDRVVLEVHDIDGRLESIRAILSRQGFTVKTSPSPGQGELHMVCAIRPNARCAQRPPTTQNQPLDLPALLKDIRTRSEAFLAPSMLPARITALPELPLTINGKIDRPRLREMTDSRPAIGLEPRSETEHTICELMSSVLAVEAIPADADFFAVGGTSMASIKLISAINRRLGTAIKLRTLLSNPTAIGLAHAIENSNPERPASPLS